IPPGPSEGSEVHMALPLVLSRGLSRHTTASTPSGGMPGRAGGVVPGGRTATHTESTLYLRRTCSGRRMTQMGHEDAFPRPRLSARCQFSQGTFAGTRGNGRDAPTAVTQPAFIDRL